VLRSMALSLIREFSTLSEDAGLALPGLPPIDLDIKARSLMRGGASRLEAHEWLLGKWQNRWQTSQRLAVWAECQHKANPVPHGPWLLSGLSTLVPPLTVSPMLVLRRLRGNSRACANALLQICDGEGAAKDAVRYPVPPYWLVRGYVGEQRGMV